MSRIFKAAIFVGATFAFLSCGNGAGSEAQKQADAIQQQMKQHTPGSVPVSSAGYFITAKLDGKDWAATSMMPDEDPNSSYIRISGDDGEGNSISFQLYRRTLSVGEKTAFTEDRAADVTVKDFPGFLGARKGEVEITKMDDKWLEGKFHMIATSLQSHKQVEITDGKFRVALVPGQR